MHLIPAYTTAYYLLPCLKLSDEGARGNNVCKVAFSEATIRRHGPSDVAIKLGHGLEGYLYVALPFIHDCTSFSSYHNHPDYIPIYPTNLSDKSFANSP